MQGGELFSRIQERAETAFTERGMLLVFLIVATPTIKDKIKSFNIAVGKNKNWSTYS